MRTVAAGMLALLTYREAARYTLPRETAAVVTMIATCCEKVKLLDRGKSTPWNVTVGNPDFSSCVVITYNGTYTRSCTTNCNAGCCLKELFTCN